MSAPPAHAQPAATVRAPGDWLLQPLPLVALFVLALNDRFFKGSFASWWTGKLSDFAGLLFFPWLLVAVWELLLWALRLPWRAGPRALSICVLSTLVVFSAINLSATAGAAYAATLRVLWAPLANSGGWLYPGPVCHTVDPTDLMALPALWLSWQLGVRRSRN